MAMWARATHVAHHFGSGCDFDNFPEQHVDICIGLGDLPPAWQAKLGDLLNAGFSKVTVRIEEDPTESPDAQFANDPLFGMWRDREDMADVDAYIRAIRAPLFPR